jgi:hypothetical protein
MALIFPNIFFSVYHTESIGEFFDYCSSPPKKPSNY